MKKCLQIIGIILVLSLFMTMALGSGSSSSTPAQKVGEVDKTDSESSSSKSESAKPEVSEQTEFRVGDILQTQSLKIVYMACGTYSESNEYLQPESGKKYIFLKFFCENNGKSDTSISEFSFNCFADGYQAEGYYGADDQLSASLSPGRTTTGCLYYTVPEDAKEIEIEYEVNVFSNKKVKFIYEGDKDSGYVPEVNTTASESAYKPGDIVETNSLRISYLSCEDYQSDNMFIQPKNGNKYIVLRFEVENISNSDQSIGYYSFECYADGVACDALYLLDDSLSADLSSGRKAKGSVAFEIPANAQTVEAEYIDNYWTSSRIIFSCN